MKTKAKRNRGCTSGYPRIYPLGDSALLIQLGSEIDDRINNRVLALERRLISLFPSFVRATVPAYVSLTIHYDPCQVNSEEFQTSILQQLDAVVGSDSPQGKLIKVPVVYGGEGGPDLPFVADHCGLSVAEVIRRHSQPEYRVHFIGFLPGFPYLGGMDPRLERPALPLREPRSKPVQWALPADRPVSIHWIPPAAGGLSAGRHSNCSI